MYVHAYTLPIPLSKGHQLTEEKLLLSSQLSVQDDINERKYETLSTTTATYYINGNECSVVNCELAEFRCWVIYPNSLTSTPNDRFLRNFAERKSPKKYFLYFSFDD